MTKYEEDYNKYIYSKIELSDRMVKIVEIAGDFMYSKQSVIFPKERLLHIVVIS